MNKRHDPSSIHPPLGAYTHAIEVPAGARVLFVSGQVGMRPDGTLAAGIEEQLRQTWANVAGILSSAGMSLSDIVRVNTYVTRPEHLSTHPCIRNDVLGGHRAAATGMCVTALATPEILCEIEVVAAA